MQIEERREPVTDGMFVTLWLADVVLAAEFWMVRVLQLGLRLLRPAPLVAAGLLAAGGGLAYGLHTDLRCAQERTATLDFKAIANGVELYQLEQGQVPASLEALRPRYLKALHFDPWGNSYVLFHGPGGAALVSAGPDKQLGTADDLLFKLPRRSAP